MEIAAGEYNLHNLADVNVVLGKNGVGKSTLLKAVETGVPPNDFGQRRYITPERGGVLTYEPSIDNNIFQDVNWMPNSRRSNQFIQFRQQSVAQFRRLEMSVLRQSDRRKRSVTLALTSIDSTACWTTSS